MRMNPRNDASQRLSPRCTTWSASGAVRGRTAVTAALHSAAAVAYNRCTRPISRPSQPAARAMIRAARRLLRRLRRSFCFSQWILISNHSDCVGSRTALSGEARRCSLCGVKNILTWSIRWNCACVGVPLTPAMRRVPHGRVVALRPLPLEDPQARGTAMQAMWGGALLGAKGLRLPRQAQVAHATALGGRV